MNYGERLYQKGMRRKEELAKHIELLQKQRDQHLADQYPFKPEICDRSRQLAEQQGRDCAEHELLRYGDQVKSRLEQLRSELQFREQAECVFRPTLIAKRRTEKLVSDRRQFNDAGDDVSRFAELYEDAVKRRVTQERIAAAILDNHSFRPDTSKTK